MEVVDTTRMRGGGGLTPELADSPPSPGLVSGRGADNTGEERSSSPRAGQRVLEPSYTGDSLGAGCVAELSCPGHCVATRGRAVLTQARLCQAHPGHK